MRFEDDLVAWAGALGERLVAMWVRIRSSLVPEGRAEGSCWSDSGLEGWGFKLDIA